MPKTIKRRKGVALGPDEMAITGLFESLRERYDAYRKQVLTATAALAALALLIGGYWYYQSARERAASVPLAQALQTYAAAERGVGDLGNALGQLRRMQAAYSGTMSGAIAQYYTGNALMDMGRTEDALAEYEEFGRRYRGRKELLGLVKQRMGYAYRALGRMDDALRSFEQAEELLGPGPATAEVAAMYEQAGRSADAKKKYQMLAESLPGTQIGAMAKQKGSADLPAAPSGQ